MYNLLVLHILLSLSNVVQSKLIIQDFSRTFKDLNCACQALK